MASNVEQMVKEGVAAGLTLSQIQEKLAAAGQIMTYRELRFLLDDLNLVVQEKAKAPELEKVGAAMEPAATGADSYDDATSLGAGEATMAGVSVTADTVIRPGALLSGSVNFSDGVKAQWTLDEYGRLGLMGAPADYQPSQTDLMEFQTQLRAIVEKKGLA